MDQRLTPPLLLHIGYHKTATSFLQGRIFVDEQYFCQPWGSRASQAVEQFILVHPEKFSAEDVRRDFFDKAAERPDAVPVVSHEALSGHPNSGRYYADRVAMRMHETFPDARILIGIREQKKLLASLYYQHIKRGGTDRIEEFVQKPLERPGFRRKVRFEHFEFDLTLALYRRYWKAEDILVLPIEYLQRDQNAYVTQVLDFCGWRDGKIAEKTAVNVRRSNVTMRIERVLNRLVKVPNPRPVRFRDNPLSYRMKTRALGLLDSFGPMRAMGKTEEARIRSYIDATVGTYFDASNRRLAEMTGLDLGGLGYFSNTGARQ